MATIGVSKDGSETTSDPSQPVSKITPTAPFESTTLQITNHKLNGKNYLQWSRSVPMVTRGKGKLGYLDGSIPKPNTTDSMFPNWDVQNSMVMAWLIHSMEDNIGETYLFHSTAKDVWDDVTLQTLLKYLNCVIELVIFAKEICRSLNSSTH